MAVRTFDAFIDHTGETDCSISFINEKNCYSELRRSFDNHAKVTIEIKSRRKPRNLDQNAYLHLCLQMIADDTGNSLDQVKTTLKALYAKKPLLKDGEPIYDNKTGEQAMYIQDTRDMSTLECFEFTENVRMFAIDFLGFVIPEPQKQIKMKI